MKYFLLNGTPCENSPKGPAFKDALDAHHAYWDEYVKQGIVLFGGPKVAGSGLLVIKCEDEAEAQALSAKDPFVTNGVQSYSINEFKFFTGNDCVKEWFS